MKKRLTPYQGWNVERCRVGDLDIYYAWDEGDTMIQNADLKVLKRSIDEITIGRSVKGGK